MCKSYNNTTRGKPTGAHGEDQRVLLQQSVVENSQQKGFREAFILFEYVLDGLEKESVA